MPIWDIPIAALCVGRLADEPPEDPSPSGIWAGRRCEDDEEDAAEELLPDREFDVKGETCLSFRQGRDWGVEKGMEEEERE